MLHTATFTVYFIHYLYSNQYKGSNDCILSNNNNKKKLTFNYLAFRIGLVSRPLSEKESHISLEFQIKIYSQRTAE